MELDLDGDGVVELDRNDLEISRSGLEGWQVETEDGMSVALDTDLSTELVQEGLAREFINRIQNMRKEADFEVTDRIAIGVATSDKLYEAIQAMNDYIKRETLAEKITDGLLEVSDFKKKWEIGDDNCTISIRRNPN